jgi:hypothetical protein
MELQRLATAALRVVRGHLAPLAVLLLSGALLLGAQGVAAQDVRDFNLQNASGATIIELFVSNQNASDWGSNILRGAIPPGGVSPVRFQNPRTAGGFVPCVYDIRAVTGDRQAFETTIDLCTGDVVMFPAQFDRAASGGPPLGIAGIPQGQGVQPIFFLLQNTSPLTVLGVSLSPTGSDVWSDVFAGAIQPGQTARIDFTSPACQFDMRVQTNSGQSNERRNLDLCTLELIPFP